MQDWKSIREQLRNHIPMAMIIIGLAMLTFVGVQYLRMYMEQRRLVATWEKQQRPASNQATLVDDGLTRLSIPSIRLNAIVVEGTSHRDLLLGPGHIKSTAQPGAPGNSVITAHRDTFFRHIYELQKGDTLTVQRNGKSFQYAVTGTKVVPPSDLSVLRPTSDSRLTLITCYPIYYIGPAPQRLVVFSKLIEGSNTSPGVQQTRVAQEASASE